MIGDRKNDPAVRTVRLHMFEIETLALAIKNMEAEAWRRGDHELSDIHACRAAELRRLAR
jgi:hypothetical protein